MGRAKSRSVRVEHIAKDGAAVIISGGERKKEQTDPVRFQGAATRLSLMDTVARIMSDGNVTGIRWAADPSFVVSVLSGPILPTSNDTSWRIGSLMIPVAGNGLNRLLVMATGTSGSRVACTLCIGLLQLFGLVLTFAANCSFGTRATRLGASTHRICSRVLTSITPVTRWRGGVSKIVA